jgi:predicted RNA-binding protein YlxR (DUF448 family)
VRVVRTPSGELLFDQTGRLNGRGAYLCRDAACWQAGLAKGQVARALGTPIPSDMRAALETGPEATTTQGGGGGQE